MGAVGVGAIDGVEGIDRPDVALRPVRLRRRGRAIGVGGAEDYLAVSRQEVGARASALARGNELLIRPVRVHRIYLVGRHVPALRLEDYLLPIPAPVSLRILPAEGQLPHVRQMGLAGIVLTLKLA